MGIESEQLVFDYLSRVGDLAHSARMPPGERARLVSGLRGEIDRRRAEDGGRSVRKILGGLGTPEAVVSAHAEGAGAHAKPAAPEPAPEPLPAWEPVPAAEPAPSAPGAEVPRTEAPAPEAPAPEAPAPEAPAPEAPRPEAPRPEVPRGAVPGPRPAPGGEPVPGPDLTKSPPSGAGSSGPSGAERPSGPGAAPPHLAGVDELGPQESDPDWWRVDPSPYGDGGSSLGAGALTGPPGDRTEQVVPGFTGGIELPDVLRKPQEDGSPAAPESASGGAPGSDAPAPAPKPAARVQGALKAALLGRVKGRGATAGPEAEAAPAAKPAAPGPRRGGFVELLAAGVLVVGAVTGSLIVLAVGWLAAWWSPKLSRNEAKWAAAGMPALVLGGTLVWLWGRMDGRWGDPVGEGGAALQAAMSDAFPVLLRVAALASAGFLVWRARRFAG